jgi:hypothetical protein
MMKKSEEKDEIGDSNQHFIGTITGQARNT